MDDMAQKGAHEPGHSGHSGHETRDVDVRGVSIFGGALAAVVLVVLGLMAWMFDSLASKEKRRAPSSPQASMAMRDASGQLPPEPRLQNDPVGDLARLRAEETALLESYGWVDKQRGVVRIPVERAMEIVVDHVNQSNRVNQ